MSNTNNANAIMLERVKSEFRAEYNAKPRDPFATTLASLVGGLPAEDGSAKSAAAPGAAAAASGLSRVSGAGGARAERSSRLSGKDGGDRRSRLSHAVGPAASQLSQRPQQQRTGSAIDGDMRSELSSATSASWRTPSSIRSSEPSAIARNKIAELQLRVELERVLRLQKETELEQKRREGLLSRGSAGAKAGAPAAK